MKRVGIDMNLLREQIEVVDLVSDLQPKEEQELLDGVAGFLHQVLIGKIVCYWKEDE
jgi:hypothetical protein